MSDVDSFGKAPFCMVVFGATGDLARYKLIPALFDLYRKKQLSSTFFLFGFARRDLSRKEFLDLYSHLADKDGWNAFIKHYQYQRGTFEDENGYLELTQRLKDVDKKNNGKVERLFYLATPPENYGTILDKLHATKLSSARGTKIIIEKPFGKDLDDSRGLDKKLSHMFEEKQIFRVDHYLGKEVVQNIIAFRFANGIFEPVWNAKYLDHIQITIFEKNGIKGRGKFFEGVGNLRDVAQNHLLQLVTAIAMEQPKSFTRESVRDERAAVMKALRVIAPKDVSKFVIRGQYVSYKKEAGITDNSQTETYIAMKTYVDTPRFADIPFYLRAGKKMAEDFVEISLVFKQTCHILFKEYGCPEIGNVLTFRIQPDEGINMRVIAKKPGTKLALDPIYMDFSYRHTYGQKGADAYEKILRDIFLGDQMLFNRSDELEYSWKWISQIMKGWQNASVPLYPYQDFSWGPRAADRLIKEEKRHWLISE